MLHKTSFPISVLQYLFVISEVLFHPLVWSLNHFVAPFILSTYENQWHFNIIAKRVVYVPSVFVFLTVFAIPALLGGLLRCLLHLVRRPYVLSIDKSFIPPSITERRSSLSMGKINVNNKRNSLTLVTKEKTYTICSANICLLPELLARINNLPNPAARSFEIGQRIVIDQFFFQNPMNAILSGPTKQRKSSVTSKTDKGKQKIEPSHNILTHFPKLDFLCLQETWDRDYSHKLMSELHKVFPWILYDVGKTRLSTNRFMFNSGLMFCSKYEILDANFLPFNDKVSQCLYLSKGLLMTKVSGLYCQILLYCHFKRTRKATLRSKSKNWLALKQDNVSKWNNISTKFFHYFHLSDSSFTSPGLPANGLTRSLYFFYV